MRWRLGGPAGLFAILAIALVSCRQVAGIDDRPADPAACGGFTLDVSCKQCIERSCCNAARTCRGEPECEHASSCLFACPRGDSKCQAACDASSRFTTARAELLSCWAGACVAECGGFACAAVRPTTPSCGCDLSPCCKDAVACASDSSCGRLRACEEACTPGDLNCRDDCRVAAAGAVELRVRAERCAATECPIRASGDWACIGHVSAPAASPPFTIVQTFQDQQSQRALRGLAVALCNQSDTQCKQPVHETTTDDTGTCSIEVPGMAFPGYFYVHGVADGTAYEALVYQRPFGNPVRWVIPSVETVVGLGTALGKPIDPSRGVLLLSARDCSGAIAEGVSFTATTADSDTTAYYVLAGAPSLARSETLASANGQGGFANLPGGYATVTANINGLCALYGRMDLLVRAGAITIANFPPTPLD